MSARKLDALYAEYAQADKGDAKERAREKLVRALYVDAYPIMYHKLRGFYPDIITDAVATAATNLDKFRGEARFSTWFYRIVVNYCNLILRVKQQRNEVSLEEMIEEHGDGIAGSVEAEAEAKAKVADLLDNLAPDQKRLVEMKAEGMNDKEIGEALGISAKAVNERLRRIRTILFEKVNAGQA